MTSRQVTSRTADRELRLLYESAFPENEKIPWKYLLRLIEPIHLDFTAYRDQGRFVGFTIVYPGPSFNWLWYFAVEEQLRGKGYGGRILACLKERYQGQNCVLDMESPRQEDCDNLLQRKRRYDFYLRNGFRGTDVYRWYGDTEMTIMMTGKGGFTLQDWDGIVNNLKQSWIQIFNKG